MAVGDPQIASLNMIASGEQFVPSGAEAAAPKGQIVGSERRLR